MKYRKLGSSSLEVSEIGFGCMSLDPHAKESEQLIRLAAEQGINFFDTADLYDKGLNEECVGRALRQIRSQVYIATKVGNQWRADGSGWDWNPSGSYIKKAIDATLRRLQTDYIDLYQLHGGTMEDNMEEIVEAFQQLQQQGKIRYFGISSIKPAVIERYARNQKICSVMMQYSLLDKRPEDGSLHMLQQHNISVLARGVLAKGLLAGKPSTAYLDHSAEEVQAIAAAMKKENPGKTPEQIAIGYVLGNPAVASAVTGIRTKEQLMAAVSYISQPRRV